MSYATDKPERCVPAEQREPKCWPPGARELSPLGRYVDLSPHGRCASNTARGVTRTFRAFTSRHGLGRRNPLGQLATKADRRRASGRRT